MKGKNMGLTNSRAYGGYNSQASRGHQRALYAPQPGDQHRGLRRASSGPKPRGRSVASLEDKGDLFANDAATISLWQQAAGLYSTDADEGELSWQADALCAQTDPEAFFPEKGGSTRDAKRVCSECPVREACLDYAMENDERFGIWGGLSERERRRLRKQASL